MRIYTTAPISWQKLLHIRSAIHMGVCLPSYDMFTLYKSRRVDALIEPIGKSSQQILCKPRDFIAYENCERCFVLDSSAENNYKATNILGEVINVPHTFENGDKIVIEDIATLHSWNNTKVLGKNKNIDEYLQVYLM